MSHDARSRTPMRTGLLLSVFVIVGASSSCGDERAITPAPTTTVPASTDTATDTKPIEKAPSRPKPLDDCPSAPVISELVGEPVEETPSGLGGDAVVFDCRFRLEDSSSFGMSVERHPDPGAAFEQGRSASPGAQPLDGIGDDAYVWTADDAAAFVAALSGDVGCTARWSSFSPVERSMESVLVVLESLVRLACGI